MATPVDRSSDLTRGSVRNGQSISLATVLRRPLLTSIAATFVSFATIVITVSILVVFVRPTGARYARAIYNLQNMHAAMIDQETGLRGFLLTHDAGFLQPYTVGRSRFTKSLVALRTQVAGDATLVSSLDVLAAASQKWQQDWAQPLLTHQPRNDDQPALDSLLKRGQTLFDAYRLSRGHTLSLLQHRRAANHRASFWVSTCGAALGVLASGILLLFVTRSSRAMRIMVLPPVGAICATLTALADGRLKARVDVSGPIEMREIGTDINRLGVALHRTEEARAIQAGKLRYAHAARDDAIAAGDAKEEFLAVMSHEIRTPLNAVIGLTDLLLTTDLDEHQRQDLGIISRSGDTLLALVNDVLDYSRIAAGELNLESCRFDLLDVVQGVAEILSYEAESTHLHLRTAISTDTPRYLIGDAARIRQILLNLGSNAVKFTDHGEVVISASLHLADANVNPDQHGPPDPMLTVTVRDTGIGIAADVADRLFQPFTQADPSINQTYGGTGLGLAISRRIARAMGGDITLASTLGAGSQFTLAIPVDVPIAADVASIHSRDDTEAPSLLGLRVLAVDHNSTSRAALAAQIERNGGRCVPMPNAAEALAVLDQDHYDFDVALVDFDLSDMDAVDLAGLIQHPRRPRLPLVLVSDSAVPGPVGAVFDATLRKPVSSNNLAAALRFALNQAPSNAGAAAAAVSGLRVLIVEDASINQDLMVRFVTHLGHHADLVANGADAITALRRTPYDVVLIDAQMPVMDGVEATRIIRTLAIDQPRIVAVTAGAFTENRDRFLAAGADQFCTKPIRLNELAQAITPPGHATVAAVPSSSPGPTPVPCVPDYDHDVLDGIPIEGLYKLGPVAAQQIIDRFVAYLLPAVDEIIAAAAAGNPIRPLAHVLTGSSAFFGAIHVTTIGALLQDETHPAERRAELITQLRHEALRAHIALRALVAANAD